MHCCSWNVKFPSAGESVFGGTTVAGGGTGGIRAPSAVLYSDVRVASRFEYFVAAKPTSPPVTAVLRPSPTAQTDKPEPAVWEVPQPSTKSTTALPSAEMPSPGRGAQPTTAKGGGLAAGGSQTGSFAPGSTKLRSEVLETSVPKNG